MTRSAVEPLLPGGRKVLTRNVPDGITLTFVGDPERGATSMVRQLFLRFDAAASGQWTFEVLRAGIDGLGLAMPQQRQSA